MSGIEIPKMKMSTFEKGIQDVTVADLKESRCKYFPIDLIKVDEELHIYDKKMFAQARATVKNRNKTTSQRFTYKKIFGVLLITREA
jgi:hypothetical protein